MPAQGAAAVSVSDFAENVRAGLTRKGQKELPSKYLYDDVGSALFEVISLLPEYGLTRADERLLRRHADAIVGHFPLPVAVAELGSGSGKKTRFILQALCRRQPTTYYPIEISASALARCEQELGGLESLRVMGLEREYLEGLAEVAARRLNHQHVLVLFLGSTIGNFNRAAAGQFLREIRETLNPGDGLLLGADLEKPVSELLAAYDDPLGVTAAFNLNLLARINRELDADFVLSQFRHEAPWNAEERRIDMFLRSNMRQSVHVRKARLTVTFEEGETIWTESCHKYGPAEIAQMAARAGFKCAGQWIDREWPFAESLLVVE